MGCKLYHKKQTKEQDVQTHFEGLNLGLVYNFNGCVIFRFY